jgi:hypothetical protein
MVREIFYNQKMELICLGRGESNAKKKNLGLPANNR